MTAGAAASDPLPLGRVAIYLLGVGLLELLEHAATTAAAAAPR